MIDSDDPASDRSKILSLIGQVANESATLEFEINAAIWELANVEQRAGACITSHIGSMNPRIRALVSLVDLRGGDEELIREINQFAGKAEGISRQRNRVVHDPWYIRGDTAAPHQLRVTADRKLEFDFVPVPMAEVEDLIKKMSALQDRFMQLKERIFAELPPFDRKCFQQSHGIWDYNRRHSKTDNEP